VFGQTLILRFIIKLAYMKPTVKYGQVNFVLIHVVFGIGWGKKGDALSPWLLTFVLNTSL
jgi:hypothetical protein